MNFYTKQHRYYCGIDLHARSMYLCVLNQAGEVLLHQDLPTGPEPFLKAIEPFREDVVAAVECIFTWYWLANLCRCEKIPFVLGHALYMKAIHGGKAKNDKIDSRKIAGLLRGGMLPQAYVYPPEMRSTRDLLPRRTYLVRQRSELLAHIQNTNSQCNLPEFGRKIGNAHLKWAFSEAAVLFLRCNPEGLKYKKRLEKKHGKGKALSIIAHKLGRAVYFMLDRRQAFEMSTFLAA